ncbi:MAG: recombinase family protein, partial [Alphaproteobacteria bacterium]|nr:recombinase family protein [Alphaproteobacteria bacterium]
DDIPSPTGKKWIRKTILGYRKKKEGILRNEIYIGTLVYNKTKLIVNPETKKPKMIVKPQNEWVRGYVPALRIVSDDLWKKARNRDIFTDCNKKRLNPKPPRKKKDLKKNQSALTGFVFCNVCGGQKSLGKFRRYICDNNRYHHSCRNGRSANENQIFEKLWDMLFDRVKNGDTFKSLFEKKITNNKNLLDFLKKKEKDLKPRLERLTEGIENGVDGCLDRAIELKKEYDNVKEAQKTFKSFEIPDEDTIQEKILKNLGKIKAEKDTKETRAMLNAVIDKIVLTPKTDKRYGEDIKIFLKPDADAWSNFWLLITKK